MTDITGKEWKNAVIYITERATVTNNIMERAAIMYVIMEQYRTCNRNDKHYRTNATTYIMALKRKQKDVQA